MKVDCEPGYLLDVIKKVSEDIEKNVHGADCVMSLDEMAIRKGLRWDPGTKSFIGFPTIPWSEEDRQIYEGVL